MEMPIEKPFTGAVFNVALIGADCLKVRDTIATPMFEGTSGMIDMVTKNFKLSSGLDAQLHCSLDYTRHSKFIFKNLLQTHYSMVVICFDADDGANLYELDEMIKMVSESAKTSTIKMCIVSKLKDSDFGLNVQDTAKTYKIPFISFESLNTGTLFLQLEGYANELANMHSPKIASQFWGKPFELKYVNQKSLTQVFENAKKDYIKSNAYFLKPEVVLNYQINNRIPKNLSNENCCEALCALLKDEGKTTLNSYKFFVITHLLNGDIKMSSDEEAKSRIDFMISLLNDFNARGHNKNKDAVTKVMYMRFFANGLGAPKEVTDMITQKYIEVREPKNNESSPITPKG